jgi:DNA-binding XRE family transcriptional regulator
MGLTRSNQSVRRRNATCMTRSWSVNGKPAMPSDFRTGSRKERVRRTALPRAKRQITQAQEVAGQRDKLSRLPHSRSGVQANPVTAAQCRLARTLLGWSQKELAKRSGLNIQTISRFERGARAAQEITTNSVWHGFEMAGIARSAKLPGVRFTKRS